MFDEIYGFFSLSVCFVSFTYCYSLYSKFYINNYNNYLKEIDTLCYMFQERNKDFLELEKEKNNCSVNTSKFLSYEFKKCILELESTINDIGFKLISKKCCIDDNIKTLKSNLSRGKHFIFNVFDEHNKILENWFNYKNLIYKSISAMGFLANSFQEFMVNVNQLDMVRSNEFVFITNKYILDSYEIDESINNKWLSENMPNIIDSGDNWSNSLLNYDFDNIFCGLDNLDKIINNFETDLNNFSVDPVNLTKILKTNALC